MIARVGLEVHVRLATGRRLFTTLALDDAEVPNRQVDAFVLAEPGVLPVLDWAAVELVGRAAVAVGARVSPTSEFDRKHYQYPDLPRGFQITQQAMPFAVEGTIEATVDGRVVRCALERMHLEDDAGRSVNSVEGRRVDLDRAGGALVEVVTCPTLRSGAETEAVLRELHAILVAAGVTRGALETGDMRCDANVSVAPEGRRAGDVPRVELKNLNSFRNVRLAVDCELERQRALLAAGETVGYETRRWTGTATEATREKRESEAYGWLPEADLPSLIVTSADIERWRTELPELPAASRARLVNQGVRPDHARDLVASRELLALCDATDAPTASVARWLLGSVAAARNAGDLRRAEDGTLRSRSGVALCPRWLATLCQWERAGRYTAAQLEQVADECWRVGCSPEAAAHELGVEHAASEDEARALVLTVLRAHPEEVARYRSGKRALLGFFLGVVRQQSAGAVEPAVARALLESMLTADPNG